jgi:hypothetical protein
MFVQRSGRKVRSFGYRYDFDGFSAVDITALSDHITASGVVWMAYQQEPDFLLWAVRADGKLLSCTIDRDQQPSVIAWALHETDGFVECVASILALERGSLFPLLNYESNDADCPVRAAHRGDPPGDSFVSVAATPQGQTGAVAFRRWPTGPLGSPRPSAAKPHRCGAAWTIHQAPGGPRTGRSCGSRWRRPRRRSAPSTGRRR